MNDPLLPPGWPANGLEPHPIAAMFRLMDAEERADLTARIRANGLRVRIVMYEGKILDGRNRYLAAIEAGLFAADVDYRIDPNFEFFGGMGWDPAQQDPVEYVWDVNEGRRHDSASQRAMNAARYAQRRQGFRSDIAEPSANLRTVSEVAERAGVSERLMTSAFAVLDHGTPELEQAVDEGRIAVSAAEQVSRLEEAEQRIFASLDRAEARAAARQAARAAKAARTAGQGAPPVERIEPLPVGKFARFAQSVLNVARGQSGVSSETIVTLAAQHGIVEVEGEGFVYTAEALAAMGTLAAAEPKRPEAGAVSHPLPLPPTRGGPMLEFTVGGLKKKCQARFGVRRGDDGKYAISVDYQFPSSGSGGPPFGAFESFEQAIATAAFRLCSAFEGIVNAQDSVTGEHERAAARAGLKWFDDRLAGWGVVAQDYHVRAAHPQAAVDADLEREEAALQPPVMQAAGEVYSRLVAEAAAQRGHHTMESAEAILRAGVEGEIRRQQIADDIGHPIGTVLGWLSRLKLTGLGSGRAAPRPRAAAEVAE